MDHRYGRHGPRAWLKWRSRHYVPLKNLPAPTSGTKVYVYQLSSTERIIYIVTGEPQPYDEGHQELVPSAPFMRVPYQQSGEKVIELPAGDSELIGIAEVEAINSARSIRGYVSINWEKVEEQVRILAQDRVMAYLREKGGLKPNEYRRLLDVFQAAFINQFHKEVDTSPSINHIRDTRELQLRDVARQDRKTYPTYASRPLHQRDLAIIRVMEMLGLYIGDDDSALFETIHVFADRYEEYFRNLDEEVDWPPPNTFR